MNEVTIKTSVELLPFGLLRHCETVSLQMVAPQPKPIVDLRAGTTLVREILASEPARVILR